MSHIAQTGQFQVLTYCSRALADDVQDCVYDLGSSQEEAGGGHCGVGVAGPSLGGGGGGQEDRGSVGKSKR